MERPLFHQSERSWALGLAQRAVRSLKSEGPRQALSRVFNRLSIDLDENRLGDSLVRAEDAVAVDWTTTDRKSVV